MKKILLSGEWTLTNEKIGTITATVPGCVHTDLMANGTIKDLYWRDNNKQYEWIENENFSYSRTFDAVETDNATLVFEGLDTYCDIYLNGEKIGEADDMFIEHRFSVRGKLKEKNNTLRVDFRSAVKEVEGLPQNVAAFTKERLRTRRIQCTYSWDWVDRFVTAGIYRPVYIEYGNDLSVKSTYIVTENIDDYSAQICVDLEFANYENPAQVEVIVLSPNGENVAATQFYCNEPRAVRRFDIEEPMLWYPLGYGEQPIYTLLVKIGENEYRENFGIRTIKILQLPDKKGSEYYLKAKALQKRGFETSLLDENEETRGFQVIVNGKRIVCMGGNWVPCEPFPSAETKEKFDKLIALAKEMGVNMLRVWGGGIFENEYFYECCDKAGILVTQDFLMACGAYPEKEEWFIEKLKLESEYALKLLRNHPCFAWWSGDNENATRGNDEQEDYRGRRAALKGLSPAIFEKDYSHPFLPSSPYGGFPYASWTVGTTHNTNFVGEMFDYFYGEKCDDYKEFLAQFTARFIAEEPTFGAISRRSLLKFMTEDDIKDETEEMYRHHTKGNDGLSRPLFDDVTAFPKKIFGGVTDAEDKLFKYKYGQYEWVRIVFENLRRNLGYCNGLVFWMFDDCWPAALGWSFVDYYCVPKAAFYAFKRCAADCVVSLSKEKRTLVANVSNKTDTAQNVAVKAYRLCQGEVMETTTFKIKVGAYSTSNASLPFALSKDEIAVCEIKTDNGIDRTFYKDGALPLHNCTEDLRVVKSSENKVTVTSNKYIHAVEIECDGVCSDNYFSLLPNEEKTVTLKTVDGKPVGDYEITAYTIG